MRLQEYCKDYQTIKMPELAQHQWQADSGAVFTLSRWNNKQQYLRTSTNFPHADTTNLALASFTIKTHALLSHLVPGCADEDRSFPIPRGAEFSSLRLSVYDQTLVAPQQIVQEGEAKRNTAIGQPVSRASTTVTVCVLPFPPALTDLGVHYTLHQKLGLVVGHIEC